MYILNHRLFQVLGLLSVFIASPARPENQILPSVVRIQVISPERSSRGTGIAVNGGVITAAHVVDKSDLASIICDDGDDSVVFDGDVVYRDTLLDLAFIKVKNDFDKIIHLPPAVFNTQFPPAPGTPVYAIGNSLGFSRTLSAGIVSTAGTERGERFLYTDALVRKGNSGGPLVNHKGEVIAMVLGLVSLVETSKDSSPEFAYCIPAADVVKFLEDMKLNIKNDGYLGVVGKPVSTGITHPGCDRGLQITRTVRSCGLITGDIVLTLADVAISSQRDMVRVIRSLQPGTMAEAHILRNREYKVVQVSVTKSP